MSKCLSARLATRPQPKMSILDHSLEHRSMAKFYSPSDSWPACSAHGLPQALLHADHRPCCMQSTSHAACRPQACSIACGWQHQPRPAGSMANNTSTSASPSERGCTNLHSSSTAEVGVRARNQLNHVMTRMTTRTMVCMMPCMMMCTATCRATSSKTS